MKVLVHFNFAGLCTFFKLLKAVDSDWFSSHQARLGSARLLQCRFGTLLYWTVTVENFMIDGSSDQ